MTTKTPLVGLDQPDFPQTSSYANSFLALFGVGWGRRAQGFGHSGLGSEEGRDGGVGKMENVLIASLAFVGTIAAVVVGAFFSRRSEQRRVMHEKSLQQAQHRADRESEQGRWIRDQKLATYKSFLEAYNRLRVEVWETTGLDAPWSNPYLGQGTRTTQEWQQQQYERLRAALDFFAAGHAGLRILATGPTADAANKMLGPVVDPVVQFKAGVPLKERQDNADGARERCEALVNGFVDCVREELRLPKQDFEYQDVYKPRRDLHPDYFNARRERSIDVRDQIMELLEVPDEAAQN
jgi:hypothetical protein